MGMDLSPRNREIESQHFNWTGWRILGDLLDGLGCDTSRMTGSNNGDYIPAPICRDWGNAISYALGQGFIKTVFVKAEHYVGGGYDKFVVVRDGQCPANAKDIGPDDIKWLEEISLFFQRCSGCRQF